ncbi:MAG: SO_0444 family Cu/Zn efflux transporter, partial [Planctomycetes bacterium]|nr:SO_0444 family Cu/Zn efflux transporter [Planctomycetota bacterium]
MTFLTSIIGQIFWYMKESAPYMIFGIIVAGMLRHLLSEKRFTRYFGGDDFKSVGFATLFGIPLPLCSCSVLPMMVSLRQRGASKGAATAFLISTPETGVDSISLTYALLDPIFTVARPISALVTALFTGSVVNFFERRNPEEPKPPAPTDATCEEQDGEPATKCENSNGTCSMSGKEQGSFIKRSLRYGFGSLMDDLTPLLILAFLGSGLIAVILPDHFFENPVTQGWPGMFIMLFVGMPIYVCATSSTPLVAALLLKGLSPGAALVFLLAGPVTNF